MTLIFASNPATFGVVEPPPFDPVVISGIVEGTPSDSGVTISWDVAPNAQGQLEYEANSGAPYASATTLDTGFLSHHSQVISGLAADTVYYYRVKAVSATGEVVYSGEGSFTTAPTPPGTGGYTPPPIDPNKIYVWPTGPGYTSGAASTVRANLRALIVGGGSGTATAFVKHSLPAGAIYTVDGGIFPYSPVMHHILFEGNGTQVHTVAANGKITATGNTGGATIRNTHVHETLAENNALFSNGHDTASTTYRGQDIRFHALNLEGNNTNLSGPSMGSGDEQAAAIAWFGMDGGEVAYCTFDKFTGDCIALNGGAGSWTAPSDTRSRNITVHHSWLKRAGRVCYFAAKTAGIVFSDVCFDQAAFAFVDMEPDKYTCTNGANTFLRCTFTGQQNQQGGFYMSPIFITRVNAEPGTFLIDGDWTVQDCVFDCTNASYGSNPSYGHTEVHTSGGSFSKTAGFRFINNKRVANPHPGPVIRLGSYQGPCVVTGNTGPFITSGSFVQDLGGNTGGITQSGNS